MPLAAGDRLGPYEIVSKIGAGGMGEVFKARDTRLDRTVALKVSKAQFSERFEREARAIAQLNHPHICQLYDVGPNYLVMEYVEGAPLKGPLPLDKAVEYAGQILDALDEAHRKAIHHRDLKPANILLTAKQGIKLLDFGLAKFETGPSPLRDSDETITQALTQQGQILGTLQYMAPEQLQAQATDARSDLFSFGCVFYEMLSGKRAFEGTSAASLIAAILEREPQPLSTTPPLDRVIRRALAKDPDHRFQTARDLKAALLWASEQPASSVFTPAPPVVRARSWMWPATVAALILGAALGWAIDRSSQAAPDTRATSVDINPPAGGRFAFGVNVGGIAISPNGRNITFVANVNGINALWVRALESTTPRMLPGTEQAGHPFWSPDGKSIAFTAGGSLERIDLAGGTPVTLYKGPTQYGGAWSEDGSIIFATFGGGISRVPANGGPPTPLTTLSGERRETAHYWPQFLPGRRFLYWARTEPIENSNIYAASLDKPSEAVRILNSTGPALFTTGPDGQDYLLWLRGDTLMAQPLDVSTLQLTGEPLQVAPLVGATPATNELHASVSFSGDLLFDPNLGQTQFWWYDRTGKALAPVGDPAPTFTFRLSPDGRKLAAQRGQNLWMTDVERGVSNPFVSTRSGFPAWSPDGRRLLFREGSPFNLFVKDSNGAGMEQRVTEAVTNQYASDWSRDGRTIAYMDTDSKTFEDLWVLTVTPEGKPDGKPRPYLQTAAAEMWPRFSPEPSPRWIAYQSNESGRNEVYVDTFPEPRGKIQISTSGGRFPAWGRTSSEIYYVGADDKLMTVSLRVGPNLIEPSTPRELFQLPFVDVQSPYDVAPDGRFLVLAGQQGAAHPLTLVLNWTSLLK